MPTRDIIRLLSGHRGVDAAPCAARLAGDRMLPHRGEPINEQDTATASNQPTPAPWSDARYFMAIILWTPENGPATLAHGPVTKATALGQALKLNGVDIEAFGSWPLDKQLNVLRDVFPSGMSGPLYGPRPAYLV